VCLGRGTLTLDAGLIGQTNYGLVRRTLSGDGFFWGINEVLGVWPWWKVKEIREIMIIVGGLAWSLKLMR